MSVLCLAGRTLDCSRAPFFAGHYAWLAQARRGDTHFAAASRRPERSSASGIDSAFHKYVVSGFSTEFQRGLEWNPTHEDALNDLGVSFVRQGKLTQAVALFERLIATDPDNADAHSNLGAVFLTQGADARAEREFRAALDISPDYALAGEGMRKLKR
jgi:tetratricopeptide (TPR) repeat protein